MQEGKQHSACDECRRRKIKCNGAKPTCDQCAGENMACLYSVRKTMGRPRKRQRAEVERADAARTDIHPTTTPPDLSLLFSQETMQLPDLHDWSLPSFDISEFHTDDMYSGDLSSRQSFSPSDIARVMPPQSNTNSIDFLETAQPLEGQQDQTQHSAFAGHGLTRNDSQAAATPRLPPCTCLSSMYIAAANMETTLYMGFPIALVPIKAALKTAKDILLCNVCPQKLSSGRQNLMLVISLMNAIASGFGVLLQDIDAETERAREAGESKTLDWGDSSATNSHLHTGGPECPGHLPLDLEPDEWNAIVKRAVKKHAYRQKSDMLTLESLVDALEKRQRAWHGGRNPCAERDAISIAYEDSPEEEWTCLKLAKSVRTLLSQLS